MSESSQQGKQPASQNTLTMLSLSAYDGYLLFRNRHPLAFNLVLSVIFGTAGSLWILPRQTGVE
jgi:hypothetical protein